MDSHNPSKTKEIKRKRERKIIMDEGDIPLNLKGYILKKNTKKDKDKRHCRLVPEKQR